MVKAKAAADGDDVPPATKQAFQCPHCARSFPSSTRYHKHLSTHSETRLFHCTYPGCSKTYKRQTHLARHLKQHMPAETTFKCLHPGCEKSFSTSTRLRRHAVVHEGLACGICGEKFRKRTKLEKHEQSHASGSKTLFQCVDCSAEFESAKALKRHMARHKAYKCGQCDQTFLRFQALAEHCRNSHPKAHLCPDCGKGFRSARNMRSHQCSVHQGLLWPCPRKDCGMVYTEKQNLQKHLRTYHDANNRMWKCPECSESFQLKHVWRRHRRVVHAKRSSASSGGEEEETPAAPEASLLAEAPVKRHKIAQKTPPPPEQFQAFSLVSAYMSRGGPNGVARVQEPSSSSSSGAALASSCTFQAQSPVVSESIVVPASAVAVAA
mmetsp:Transcript_57667/g.137184  ORF Transcript_57667/g.137184 Transcript_57667/m.137184 type:complete len:380 (+) Transcript_57667:126-1265(+)